MNAIPLLPAISVAFIGSALVILLSFTALYYSWLLVRLQPHNFIWGFLFYFCMAMAFFSLSRGVGHIFRILLIYTDHAALWHELSPYSGGVNTMLMISVAAVTIYYHKGLAAYRAIRTEAEKLTQANTKLGATAQELQELNSHLEDMVEERTRNLSESEKKFRNFFENSKDIIYFCDKDGLITNINPSGRKLLGMEKTETDDGVDDLGDVGKVNFHDFFTRKENLEFYQTQLRDRGFVSDLEMICTVQDITRHILLTANSIYDKDGVYIGCEGIGKDMTRIKNITERLINHEKMASVGQMAAGVAHEINTPLGIILGYTQLMLDDFEPESEPHSNLQVIERQSKVCKRIVADLLKFSRQAESAKSELNINEVIQEVLAVTEHNLNINQIQVMRHFSKKLPTIFGDSEKLHQVFINLFNNAQFAMQNNGEQNGGEITITTSLNGPDILVSVADTGTGIPAKIRKNIFDPFFTTKDVGKGTGLGLSVTYGIIREHQGKIEVESRTAEDTTGQTGTTFHIRIPAMSNPATNE